MWNSWKQRGEILHAMMERMAATMDRTRWRLSTATVSSPTSLRRTPAPARRGSLRRPRCPGDSEECGRACFHACPYTISRKNRKNGAGSSESRPSNRAIVQRCVASVQSLTPSLSVSSNLLYPPPHHWRHCNACNVLSQRSCFAFLPCSYTL